MPEKTNSTKILLHTLAPATAGDDTASEFCLSGAERERAGRFVFARDRWAYSAAHSLLRTLLAEHHHLSPLDWTFRNNAYGRPELCPDRHGPAAPRFNISHTHGRVAVALTLDHVPAGLDVGVDVENVARTADVLALARRFLSGQEADWLESLPATEHHTQFLRLWTLKEAVAKAVGMGLSLNFQSFHCRFDPLSVTFDQAERGRPEHWSLYNEWIAPGHWVSMAVRHPAETRIVWVIERGDVNIPNDASGHTR
mgnify:CR=1 FL=1